MSRQSLAVERGRVWQSGGGGGSLGCKPGRMHNVLLNQLSLLAKPFVATPGRMCICMLKLKLPPPKKQWNRKKLILLVVMEDKEGCPSAKPNLCYPSVLDPSTWRRWQAEDKLSPLPFFFWGGDLFTA